MDSGCVVRRRLAHALVALVTAGVALLTPSLALASNAKRLAIVPKAAVKVIRHYGGATRSLGVHVTPTRTALFRHASGPAIPNAATATPTNVKNSGGPVMSNVVIYDIFWVPQDSTAPNELLINRFTEDLGGQFVNLLSQYGVQNQLGYGGSWVDTKALPDNGKASSGNPIVLNSDIQGVITDAQNANEDWQPPSLSTLYMVYLPSGTELCDPGNGCTFAPNNYGGGQFCAYHGAFVDNADPSIPIIYGAMPDDGDRMDICSTGSTPTAGYDGSDGPNGDAVADSEISTASHEIFESLTDPEVGTKTAWNGGDNPVDPNYSRQGEIGDLCAYIFNPDGWTDGGDITMNGDRYFIQEEWDNATSSCVLPGGAILPVSHYAGCTANTLPANDDGSTDAVTLPFEVNYFGTKYSSAYVNNNGNVTFTQPLNTFSPFPLLDAKTPIIAPFFADAETRGTTPVPSGVVTYGNITYDGQKAFCVNWRNIGYFDEETDHLDSFELLLVQRSDSGDFDIIFNYDRVQWDEGDAAVATSAPRPAVEFGGAAARVGFSDGQTQSLEMQGSGTPGALVDSGPDALTTGSQGTLQSGRYIFPVRNGQNAGPGSLTGQVTDNYSPANPVAGALVQACGGLVFADFCELTTTNAQGDYTIASLPTGIYSVTASPPQGSSLGEQEKSILLVDSSPATLDFALPAPPPPPPGVTVHGIGTTAQGDPIIEWEQTTPISYAGVCPGGTATWAITAENTQTSQQQTVDGPMAETPPGSGDYTATVPPLDPLHGPGTLTITVDCPDSFDNSTATLAIYIDPSGAVVDTHGNPIPGATVTLLRSEDPNGQFTPVPDGSPVMSEGNRQNPDTTRADGSFGWDVVTGYYEIQAQKAGCADPNNPADDQVTSPVMPVPPAVNGLKLVLSCPQSPTQIAGAASAAAARFGEPGGVTATLEDGAGNPLAGKAVTFTLPGGESCTANTDAAGVASCAITPRESAGQYPVTVSFAGDWADAPSQSTGSLTVTAAPTTLSLTLPSAAVDGSSATLAATLRDHAAGPISGRQLTFALGTGAGAQTCTATTNASGTATCAIAPVTQPAGTPAPVTASFAGDGDYLSTSQAGTIPVSPAGQPSPPRTGTARVGAPIKVSSGGIAGVGLSCGGPAGAACTGRLLLTRTVVSTIRRRVRGHLRAVRVKRTVRVASATYRLSAGSSKTVKVRISGALVKLLRAAGRRGITVTVSLPGAGGRQALDRVKMILQRRATGSSTRRTTNSSIRHPSRPALDRAAYRRR